jgi:hypothetical protein
VIPSINAKKHSSHPFILVEEKFFQDKNGSPFPASNSWICFLKTSALKFRNAASILFLLASSFAIVLFALHAPVITPVSPPTKIPPAAKKVYVAISPSVVGFSSGVMSGMASSRPLANFTEVGFSDARKAANIACLLLRRRNARKPPNARPATEPISAWVLRVLAAEVRAARSVSVRLWMERQHWPL